MINRLGRYACLISLVGMINVVLPEISRADCTDKDLKAAEKQAASSIVLYKQKDKAFNDYVKTHSFDTQARTLENAKRAQFALVQADYDAMKASGCLAKSKIKWPLGLRK
jgi:hypothetical protein